MSISNEAKTSAPTPLRYSVPQIICYHITGIVLRIFFKLYGRLQIIGLWENVPRTGPILFCANHASNVDPPISWAAFYGHRRMRGVAKVELWKNKPFGYVMNAHGAISVNRGTADRGMIRAVCEGLELGDAIGIFPEGTRTYDGKLNPGMPGIGLLVQKSGAPVVPIAVLGTFEMLPRGSKRMKRTRLKIVFGKPIQYPKDMPREKIAENIMVEIAALMTQNGVPTDPPGPERAELLARHSVD